MPDDKTNVRYFLMDMTHADYDNAVRLFRGIHVTRSLTEEPDKEIDHDKILTVRPNSANTQAIVKLVDVRWQDSQAARIIEKGLTSGLFLNVYTYGDLPIVHSLLASSAWPHDTDTRRFYALLH